VNDRGSGSILAVAVLAAMLCLCGLLLPLVAVLSAKQRVEAGADAAALAGADVAAGVIPGVPCAEAERVAEANHASLAACDLDGAVVTVAAKAGVLGFAVVTTATAGPPGSGSD
jgi:secretion/DNA translocation related TadE-like protein